MLLNQLLLSHEFVGREQEIEQLHHTWQRAVMGNPQFLLVAGEAGIGKTRLCRTFMQSIPTQQVLRFWGRALPQDTALPFALFRDAFRRSSDILISSLRQMEPTLVTSFSFLADVLPELSNHVPALTASTSVSVGSSTKRQQLLFHDMLKAFYALAQLHQQPILFVLEDLHWSDETSLELLSFLAQQLSTNSIQSEPSLPLLLLGTYRHEALPNNPVLQRMIWHLHAQRCITELHLAPLNALEHRRYVNLILDQEVPEQFADYLFSWDEGNPFYTEELLGTMAATGQLQKESPKRSWTLWSNTKLHLPSSIKGAILERFMQLPALDQEILTYASVLGRTFDFPLLVAVSKIDEHTIVKVLSRAISWQLLNEVTNTHMLPSDENIPARYQFRHALIREAIYDRLHMAECRLYHRMVAERIEQISNVSPAAVTAQPIPFEQAAVLTKHYQLAGLLEQARPYALLEAQRAEKLCAFREERYYLDLAQASLPEYSEERLALLERLGMLSMGIYDFEGALEWLTMAQRCYEHLEQLQQALGILAHMLLPKWSLAHPSLPQLVSQLETGTEQLLTEGEHVRQTVEVLTLTSYLALYRGSNGQLRRASHWIEIGKNLYRTLNDPRKEDVIQACIIEHGYLKANQQAILAKEGMADIRAVIRYAHQHSLLNVLMFSYLHLAIIKIFRGDAEGAEEVFQEAIDYEHRSGIMHPSFVQGWHHFFSGQWEEEIQRLQSNVESLKGANALMLSAVEGMVLAHILLARENYSEAEGYLQQAQSLFEPLQQETYLLWTEWGLAKLLTAQNDQAQAQRWYERALERWRAMDEVLLIPPILLDGIRYYVQNNNLAQAKLWIEILRNVASRGGTAVSIAALAEAEGVIAAKQGAFQVALQKLKQAVEAWETLTWRYRQAEVSLQVAELLLMWAKLSMVKRQDRQKARNDAEQLLESAERLYEQLQILTALGQVKMLRSHAQIDVQRKRRKTLAERHSLHGLTPKEMQVLSHLVAGKTNKEIAQQLCITSGTVELHVTHILTKLQCETRTQAVAKAISEGLVKARIDSEI